MSQSRPPLGLSRNPGDALFEVIERSGFEPRPLFVTRMELTPSTIPEGDFDAAIILSPAAAQAAIVPPRLPVLVTGEATGAAFKDRTCLISPIPKAEGLWQLVQERFPAGGHFLLIRGERSRGYLDDVSRGTPWRFTPWITHREMPIDPLPDLKDLDAVLALSPLQAEVLAPIAQDKLRFAWGERSAKAFAEAGFPATAFCPSSKTDLLRMLQKHLSSL